MGDLIADEIAYAFGKKLDECCFLGDGTATYGHIEGLTGVIKRQVSDTGGTWATDADHERSAACINLTGNLFSEALITDFEKAIGLLPDYADNERTAWYCHKTFWANAMVRLALASSGNATENFANGVRKTFMGYPVVITQAMPTQADDTVVCFLGDLRQVGWIGDRREMRIGISEHYAFNSDLVTIKGTERVDFVCVDQGTPNSTPASIAATDRPGWIGLATIS
jgi:HK97 family phage major capsid protein